MLLEPDRRAHRRAAAKPAPPAPHAPRLRLPGRSSRWLRLPPAPRRQPTTAAAPATLLPRLPQPTLRWPALPARVKALQDEIEAISKAAADGSWEPAKLYAAVLVARRHLKDVWRGFADVNEYMECLCQALTCMIKGHAAIGELTRQDAVNQCHRESWKAACEHLEQNTVEEVLAEYLRVCGEPCDERPGPDREDQDRHRDRDRPDRDDDRDRDETMTGTTTVTGTEDRDRDDDRDRDGRP